MTKSTRKKMEDHPLFGSQKKDKKSVSKKMKELRCDRFSQIEDAYCHEKAKEH